MSECSVEDCNKKRKSRGLCDKHYARLLRKGNTDDPVLSGVKRIEGQKFGKLVAIRFSHMRSNGAHWHCECECGGASIVRSALLANGTTKSCGCISKPHGMSYTAEHKAWSGMKERCLNPNNGAYKDYGGRGIKVCDEWLNDFIQFYKDMGPKPERDYSIDREDVDGDYCPNNCRWATPEMQARNRRVKKGSKTGVTGVSARKSGSYAAYIGASGGKNVYLGTHKDFFEALCARKSAENIYFAR